MLPRILSPQWKRFKKKKKKKQHCCPSPLYANAPLKCLAKFQHGEGNLKYMSISGRLKCSRGRRVTAGSAQTAVAV